MLAASTCVGLLGVLVFGLGFGVSLVRGATGTAAGYADDPADRLYKWVRAHGNTVEYAPMLAVLMLWLGGRGAPAWVGWTMVVATAARYLIVVGILASPTLAKPHPARFVGAVGTYVAGMALAIAALVY